MEDESSLIPVISPGRWRDRILGQKIGSYWVLAAIVGGCSISLVSSAGTARLVLPVAVMAAYAWIAYRYTGLSSAQPALHAARIAQLADSIYFLGFLWTLWALIDSFVLKGLKGGEGVFHVFGYALVTTAFGMFLRLVLVQFKYGGEDQAGEAQLSVEQELQRFSVEVSETAQTVREFRTNLGRAFRSFQKTSDDLTATVADIGDKVQDLRQVLKTVHEQSLEQFHADIGHSLETMAESLNTPVQALVSSVRDLTGHVETAKGTVHDGGAQIGAALGAAGVRASGALEGAAAAIGKSAAAVLSELEKSTVSVEQELKQFSGRIADIEVPEDVIANTEGLARHVRDVETALAGLVNVLGKREGLDSALEDLLAVVRDRARAMNAATSPEKAGAPGNSADDAKDETIQELHTRIVQLESAVRTFEAREKQAAKVIAAAAGAGSGYGGQWPGAPRQEDRAQSVFSEPEVTRVSADPPFRPPTPAPATPPEQREEGWLKRLGRRVGLKSA